MTDKAWSALVGAAVALLFSWATSFWKSRKKRAIDIKKSDALEKYYTLEGARKESLRSITEQDPRIQALDSRIASIQEEVVSEVKKTDKMSPEEIQREFRKLGY